MSMPPWFIDICSRLAVRDSYIVNLNLNIRKLNPEMMHALAVSLERNNILEVLNLTSSLIEPHQSLTVLAKKVLCDHTSLKVLYLSYNKLQHVQVIGHALKTNRCLKELHLDHNRVGAENVMALAEAIEHNNQTLEVLQLNSNQLGDVGAQAIAQAVTKNTSIRELGLSRNQIGTCGAEALRKCLDCNMTLTQLDLWENNIVPEVVEYLTFLVRANKAGRKFLRNQSMVDTALWLSLFEKAAKETDILFFFLTSKPDLCRK